MLSLPWNYNRVAVGGTHNSGQRRLDIGTADANSKRDLITYSIIRTSL